MFIKLTQALCISFSLLAITQVGHTAATNKISESKTIAPLIKPSPIEKALQQRAEGKAIKNNNALKDITILNVPPSQSFLAAQNERFSRFIQSIFAQNNS